MHIRVRRDIIHTMANIKSSKKRIGVAESKRVQNKSQKSEINTYVKKFNAAITAKDKAGVAEMQAKCTSLLDKAAQDGVIHANKAARAKAKMAKQAAMV